MISLSKKETVLRPDHRRVLLRPENPSEERRQRIIARVSGLSQDETGRTLDDLKERYAGRHPGFENALLARYDQVEHLRISDRELSPEQKLLVGAYLLREFSFESTALFNPSIVPFPGASENDEVLRFVMSLRAVGEGHVSSIEFRTGGVNKKGEVMVDPAGTFAAMAFPDFDSKYNKELFGRKLYETGYENDFSRQALKNLGQTFTLNDLNNGITSVRRRVKLSAEADFTIRAILLLAQSNYEAVFPDEIPLASRVIFPHSPTEANGIEDARFTAFREDDGEMRYYAPYAAYDGKIVLPQLMQTPDFRRFQFITLNGPAARNKGMALFPRRLNGLYAMLGRQDDENISLMYSEHLHFWYESRIIIKPAFPWEFNKIGNCGSPIETEAGWLVLTHGVGSLRSYYIGAALLDRNDPAKVLGRLREPLIIPSADERDGYVPNVVYTCGALRHGDFLVIPYGVADTITSFVTVRLADLLASLRRA